MEISEQCMLPLNMEDITEYRPRKEEERMESRNLEIDVQVNEEDEQLLKLREIPRRKSSTGSTSASKPEDPSELFSYPSSPSNLTSQEFQKTGVFFGKDRNCTNRIFNFYQITEEHLRETLIEYKDYIKTGNYISKKEYFKKISDENKNKNDDNPINTTNENKTVNTTNTFQNTTQLKAIPAIIGAFTPNTYGGNKGKFDLPMYYCVGFYQWDTSNLIQNQEKAKKEENVQEKESVNKEEKKPELNNNNNNYKPNEKKEQPMIIGTPIFFNTIPTIPKYCYNKMYKRKTKVFTEREGDWVCNNCKNLNFAFRVECNRCHLPKGSNEKKEVPIEITKENKENQEQKGHKKNHKYRKGNTNYYGKNKGNEKGKE